MRKPAAAVGAVLTVAALNLGILPAGAAVTSSRSVSTVVYPEIPGPGGTETGIGQIKTPFKYGKVFWCLTATRLKTVNTVVSIAPCDPVPKKDPLQEWHVGRTVPGGITIITLLGTHLCLGQFPQKSAVGNLAGKIVDCSGMEPRAHFTLKTGIDQGYWLIENGVPGKGTLQLTSPRKFNPRTKSFGTYWHAGGADPANYNQHWQLPKLELQR